MQLNLKFIELFFDKIFLKFFLFKTMFRVIEKNQMVGVVRFELTTPCTQNRCASQATPHSAILKYK